MRETSFAVASLLSLCSLCQSATPVFTKIDAFPNINYMYVWSLSHDGQWVVGHQSGPSKTAAYVWSKQAGLTDLGLLPGAGQAYGFGITDDGQLAVGMMLMPQERGFRWVKGAGLQPVPALPSLPNTRVEACSSDGTIAVGYSSWMPSIRASMWTAEGVVDLGALGGDGTSWAMDISRSGSVVVGYTASDLGGRAFRWTKDHGMQSLGVSSGQTISLATATNADGSVIVGYQGPTMGSRAARWTQWGGMQDLGALPGFAVDAEALDVSDNGLVTVGYARDLGPEVGFIHTPWMGMVPVEDYLASLGVDFSGWTLNTVSTISGDGTAIAGSGMFGSFEKAAWIVQGLPAPFHCRGDCNGSGTLTVDDFLCFQAYFSLGEAAADCDADGVLSIDDFICFQTDFSVGC